jgi:Tfp pilus assembly protein FimT
MNRGVTLVELLLVLGIIVSLVLVISPYSTHLTSKNLIRVRQDQLLNAVKFSRNQAIILDKPLVLSKLPNAQDWSSGMILYIGENKTNQYQDTKKILHQWLWNKHRLEVKWNGFRSDDYIIFNNDSSLSDSSGHFEIRQSANKKAALIVLNRFGRARLSSLD